MVLVERKLQLGVRALTAGAGLISSGNRVSSCNCCPLLETPNCGAIARQRAQQISNRPAVPDLVVNARRSSSHYKAS
jgi:hypothetical protein